MPKKATFKIDDFHVKKSLSIKLEHHQKMFLGSYSRKKKQKKILFFEKNHGLTPSRRTQKWRLLKLESLKFRNPF